MLSIKKICLVGIAIFSLLSIAACNTVEGFGKDVKHGGQKIERTAEKSKES